MSINASEFIWHNGSLVPWKDATVHVLSHALHYGSSVFEGIRVYETNKGASFFRLRDHTRRLYDSAKIYRMEIPFSQDQLNDACHLCIDANGLHKGAYVRPIVFRGYGGLSVTASEDTPNEVSIAAFEWGAYLGSEALEQGVDVCVSSWNRVAPNTIPAAAKAGGTYLSSQLIAMEAQRLGFAEGIGLTVDGMVSEGSGENLFFVRDDRIITPPLAASILGGITRDTVVKLATDLGMTVQEQPVPREMLYICDELFMTGTAVEITPVKSVDGIAVGTGSRGPVTKAIQDAFFGLFSGSTADKYGWLEAVQGANGESDSMIAL